MWNASQICMSSCTGVMLIFGSSFSKCAACPAKASTQFSFLFNVYMPSQFTYLINNHHIPPLKRLAVAAGGVQSAHCSGRRPELALCQMAHNCFTQLHRHLQADLESGRGDFFYSKKQSSLPGGPTFSSFNSKKHKPEVWCIRAGRLAQRQSAWISHAPCIVPWVGSLNRETQLCLF